MLLQVATCKLQPINPTFMLQKLQDHYKYAYQSNDFKMEGFDLTCLLPIWQSMYWCCEPIESYLFFFYRNKNFLLKIIWVINWLYWFLNKLLSIKGKLVSFVFLKFMQIFISNNATIIWLINIIMLFIFI